MCLANYVNIMSGPLSPDHVHILASVSPNMGILKLVQYIKGKSSRKVLMEFESSIVC
ncbi:transposase [Alphaproteobacteria bacterium]